MQKSNFTVLAVFSKQNRISNAMQSIVFSGKFAIEIVDKKN